jgi:hypothetical protein
MAGICTGGSGADDAPIAVVGRVNENRELFRDPMTNGNCWGAAARLFDGAAPDAGGAERWS